MQAESWRRNEDERRHFFRKICLSLYLKGLRKVLLWEGAGDRTELQHIDPHSYDHNSVSFPFSWSSFQHLLSNCNCSIGGLRAPLCSVLVLSIVSYLQLTDFLSSPRLYNCSTSTFFLWASQIALIQTVHGQRPDISRSDSPVIYTGAFSILTAWPGSICYNYSKRTNYIWYQCLFPVSQFFFRWLGRSRYFKNLFAFFHFYSVIQGNSKIHKLFLLE